MNLLPFVPLECILREVYLTALSFTMIIRDLLCLRVAQTLTPPGLAIF
jgi:hypothetical protein